LENRSDEEMQMGGMIGGVLFVVGILAIFTSGGNTMYMVAGDVLVAAAGIAIVVLGSKTPA
jgi:NADH:ubiquinone oxidoreductase subunit K